MMPSWVGESIPLVPLLASHELEKIASRNTLAFCKLLAFHLNEYSSGFSEDIG